MNFVDIMNCVTVDCVGTAETFVAAAAVKTEHHPISLSRGFLGPY